MKTPYYHVPFYLRPLVELYGLVFSILLRLIFSILQFTCKIRIHGEDHLAANPSAIWSSWHEYTAISFVVLPLLQKNSGKHSWMAHPTWLMRPIHYLLRMYSVQVVMGASGLGGKAAAENLITQLGRSHSTWLNPDGPSGPKRTLKNGILEIALRSERPVLPISFMSSRTWTWPSWDQKKLPYPFSTIDVFITHPVRVNIEDKESAPMTLKIRMDN